MASTYQHLRGVGGLSDYDAYLDATRVVAVQHHHRRGVVSVHLDTGTILDVNDATFTCAEDLVRELMSEDA